MDAELRTVEIGWHPVAGMGGKWLAEKSGIGKRITASIGKYPDPTQHVCHFLFLFFDLMGGGTCFV